MCRVSLPGCNDVGVFGWSMPGILTTFCTRGTRVEETRSRSNKHSCKMWLIKLFAFVISQESCPPDIYLILWCLCVLFVSRHCVLVHTGGMLIVCLSLYDVVIMWCLKRLDGFFTILAAVLFSGELFHGARTLILSSVNPVSLSPHIVSSWVPLLCFSVCSSLYLCFSS